MLTLLLLLPLAGAVVVLAAGRDGRRAFQLTLFTTLAMLATGIGIAAEFDPPGGQRFDFLQSLEWLPSLGARYAVGIDGVSLLLILLTLFLAPITVLGAHSAVEHRERAFYFWFLILHFAILGALIARDLFLFFVFWELMLVPMYLMISIWGGAQRLYAALKFFLYTVVGSLPMLIALVYLGIKIRSATGQFSFALDDLQALSLTSSEQLGCFLAFSLSFAIKVPLWPFHTWLPDAHTEAPTPGSVILAGVLLKMGGYGFFRVAIPLFPDAASNMAPVIGSLALIAIVAGSLVAMVQSDLKRLVAYSSVAHMGAVMLGLFTLNEEGMSGGIFQMLAHGISTGALFLLVGFLYERRHTREFSEFGGLAGPMPLYATFFVIVAFSSIALPGTNGFIGEFLIFAGALKYHPVFAAIAVLGAILGAWYMLSAVRRVFFGEITNPANRSLRDLNGREIAIMVPLVVAIFWMGIGSRTFLDSMKNDVEQEVAALKVTEEPR